MQGLKEAALFLHEVNDALLADHLAVDANAFAEVHKMRAGIESHAVALLLQDGCYRVGAGALAVCASHMDCLEKPVGMTKVLIQGQRVGQSLFIRRSTHVFENRGAIV